MVRIRALKKIELLNKIYEAGYFSASWKLAKIIMIPKSGIDLPASMLLSTIGPSVCLSVSVRYLNALYCFVFSCLQTLRVCPLTSSSDFVPSIVRFRNYIHFHKTTERSLEQSPTSFGACFS